MDADRASQVLQRLQVLEQAATAQMNARRGAEHAFVERFVVKESVAVSSVS